VLAAAANGNEAPAPVVAIPVTLSLTAGDVDAIWLMPPGAAVGVVSVQHGFARRCDNLLGTLMALARQGLIVLCLNADMAGGNLRLARALATALQDGLTPPGHPGATLPIVVSGHSAGGLFASHLGAALAREAPDRLAGALLFDPVAGPGFADNLLAISGVGLRPVRAISAPYSGCNAKNIADPGLAEVTRAARAAGRDTFVGLRLVDRATHIDAEGEDTSALAVWACGQGAPQPSNVALLRELAAVWALEMVKPALQASNPSAAGPVEQAIADGRAVPIQ
jgi:hypothetical protein